jgi:uncharacterized damage-inducible protein DinB
MITCEYIHTMAGYNRWMNEKVFAAASRLSADELAAERGAFFGSVIGTLNHVMVADLIWLKRFTRHPTAHAALAPLAAIGMPTALDQPLYEDFARLRERRAWLDGVIQAWADSLTAEDIEYLLEYADTRGNHFRKRFAGLVMHFFNHQTHHRGQVTTLLSQAGVDVGETDLRALLADEPAA